MPPMKGFPLEFGNGASGHKSLNDGATRWSKKFKDRFSRFDTIPAVTDRYPPTHPASQPRRCSKDPAYYVVRVKIGGGQKCTSEVNDQWKISGCIYMILKSRDYVF